MDVLCTCCNQKHRLTEEKRDQFLRKRFCDFECNRGDRKRVMIAVQCPVCTAVSTHKLNHLRDQLGTTKEGFVICSCVEPQQFLFRFTRNRSEKIKIEVWRPPELSTDRAVVRQSAETGDLPPHVIREMEKLEHELEHECRYLDRELRQLAQITLVPPDLNDSQQLVNATRDGLLAIRSRINERLGELRSSVERSVDSALFEASAQDKSVEPERLARLVRLDPKIIEALAAQIPPDLVKLILRATLCNASSKSDPADREIDDAVDVLNSLDNTPDDVIQNAGAFDDEDEYPDDELDDDQLAGESVTHDIPEDHAAVETIDDDEQSEEDRFVL